MFPLEVLLALILYLVSVVNILEYIEQYFPTFCSPAHISVISLYMGLLFSIELIILIML